MFNLMCFLTMSQFLWFLRRFSRSVGGCVLSTDGPRKDPRHTVQVSFLRRFIGVAAVCSSQRGEKHDRSRYLCQVNSCKGTPICISEYYSTKLKHEVFSQPISLPISFPINLPIRAP